MTDVALRISKPALLLNRIAQRYSRMSRILMEYVDNGLDSAETLFNRETNSYSRPISIQVIIDKSAQPQVICLDNCNGMTENILERLIQNVGESMKHSQFTNGQFGFGVHAFRAACKKMRVVSKCDPNGQAHQILIDRNNDKFTGSQLATNTSLTHETGTEILLTNFDKAWVDGLNPEEIVKEIQFHFDGLLGRKNLNITVRTEGGVTKRCRPFDYRTVRGNKVSETMDFDEFGKVTINLWVSNTAIPDQSCYFVSNGRRIAEISEVPSFMKASIGRWSVWKHPNLVGFIEVSRVLEPVITRDEFLRTPRRAKVYKTVIKEVEPVLAQLINKANKKRRVLEMGKLGSIISRCFNVAVRADTSRSKTGKSYLDQLQKDGATLKKKRTLEDLEREEQAMGDPNGANTGLNFQAPEMDGIAMPAKKKRKTNHQKAEKIAARRSTGRFRMVFVNDLKDASGKPKRAQLIGEDVYINVQHPDFESRVNYSRKSSKLQITERLCSYLANIAATAYKSNMIQRSREGLRKYYDSHFQLFDEILDLEFSIECQLRKYLPAIQREIDGAEAEDVDMGI